MSLSSYPFIHQTVSTEASLLIRNSVEINNTGHTNIENMRQSGNKFSLVDRPKPKQGTALTNKH